MCHVTPLHFKFWSYGVLCWSFVQLKSRSGYRHLIISWSLSHSGSVFYWGLCSVLVTWASVVTCPVASMQKYHWPGRGCCFLSRSLSVTRCTEGCVCCSVPERLPSASAHKALDCMPAPGVKESVKINFPQWLEGRWWFLFQLVMRVRCRKATWQAVVRLWSGISVQIQICNCKFTNRNKTYVRPHTFV